MTQVEFYIFDFHFIVEFFIFIQVSDENSINDSSTVVSENSEIIVSRRRNVLNSTDNTFHEKETNHRSKPERNMRHDMNETPTIAEARTLINSSIGSARSKPSPTIDHYHKPTYIRDGSPTLSSSSKKTNQSLTSNDFNSSFEQHNSQSIRNTKTSRFQSFDRQSNSSDIQETRF